MVRRTINIHGESLNTFSIGRELIKLLLKHIDLNNIDSEYVRSMIESSDKYLIDELHAILGREDIELWKRNPDDIGNEYVLCDTDPCIRL